MGDPGTSRANTVRPYVIFIFLPMFTIDLLRISQQIYTTYVIIKSWKYNLMFKSFITGGIYV
ncbi:MAG: hypothetical protein K0R09_401 [Clostridiales bacterium]|nr:hypothetical protein [Clostridiales bacterium]